MVTVYCGIFFIVNVEESSSSDSNESLQNSNATGNNINNQRLLEINFYSNFG